MTTTAPEAGTVDLAQANGSAPKRRGRPPGSKNKPKETATAPKKRGRPRKTAAAPTVKKTTARRKTTAAVPTANESIKAIVVEEDGVLVITASGAMKLRSSVVVDRRT